MAGHYSVVLSVRVTNDRLLAYWTERVNYLALRHGIGCVRRALTVTKAAGGEGRTKKAGQRKVHVLYHVGE